MVVAKAWPEWKVVFPDFLHADMEALWTTWLTDFMRDQVPFDALWLVSASAPKLLSLLVLACSLFQCKLSRQVIIINVIVRFLVLRDFEYRICSI